MVTGWWSRNPGTQTHGGSPHSHVGIPPSYTKPPTPGWSRKDLALELLWHGWKLSLLLFLCTLTLSILFFFKSYPDDSSRYLCIHFFKSFSSLFFKVKKHKTMWAVQFKNPIYVAHFYYQYSFLKKLLDQFQTLSEGWLSFKLSSWSHELKLWHTDKFCHFLRTQCDGASFWHHFFKHSLKHFIPTCSARLWNSSSFTSGKALLISNFSHSSLFAQQNKYSLFGVIKPFQGVLLCHFRSWASLKITVFLEMIYWFHQKFSWKQPNPAEGIFFSAMTESWM